MKLKIARKLAKPSSTKALKRVRSAVVSFTLTRADYTPCTQPNFGLLHAAMAMQKKFSKRPRFLYHIKPFIGLFAWYWQPGGCPNLAEWVWV